MIEQVTLSPSMARQAGDVFLLHGRIYEQWRAGVLIDSRDLDSQSSVVLTEPAHVGGSSIETLFLELKMPGQIVTLTNVQKNNSTGAVTFIFSNGSNREYASSTDAKSSVEYLDTEGEVCEDCLIRKTFANSPDGTNLENMVGGSMSADFTADTPFTLVKPT